MSDRRTACILLTVGSGDVNAARRLVGGAIRKVLKVRRWLDAPHNVCYQGVAELREYGKDDTARYLLDLTDDECALLCDEITKQAENEGWSGAPIDVYHD